MSEIKWQFFDRMGWPVERIIGRPIQNFIRLLLHTRYIAKLPPNKTIVYQSYVDDLSRKVRLSSQYIRKTAPDVHSEIFPDGCSAQSAG